MSRVYHDFTNCISWTKCPGTLSTMVYKIQRANASIIWDRVKRKRIEKTYAPPSTGSRRSLFSVSRGRGCHFFIYDSDQRRVAGSQRSRKQLTALYHPRGEGSRVRVDIVSTRSRRTMGNRGSSACTLKHFCVPSHPPMNDLVKGGPDRPHFRPDNAFLPDLFSPQSLDSQSQWIVSR